jgi:hypothetical protein
VRYASALGSIFNPYKAQGDWIVCVCVCIYIYIFKNLCEEKEPLKNNFVNGCKPI